MARPKKYASDAERQAAHRSRNTVLQIRLVPETAKTLDALAEYLDVPRTEVANSLINFALLNRNWYTLGLFGKPLPNANDPRMKGKSEKREENPIAADMFRDFLIWAATKGV